MPVIPGSAKAARNAAKAYVLSRIKARIVSTGFAEKSVRAVVPDCPATDRELTDVIASAAIEKGLSVVFYRPADELQAGDEIKPHVERRDKTAN